MQTLVLYGCGEINAGACAEEGTPPADMETGGLPEMPPAPGIGGSGAAQVLERVPSSAALAGPQVRPRS